MYREKRLYRSRDNRMIAGVCGGIGEYFDVDPTIIRLLWILFIFAGGAGILAYLVAWIVIPETPNRMMYCKNCGEPNEPSAEYCRNCGERLRSEPREEDK
jgi:phage shock protein PspC (stress-responsive transcriptional regulator)